ncbi:MAG: family 16 glycosylhydrolase, partial [Pseudomonadota bacterium]
MSADSESVILSLQPATGKVKKDFVGAEIQRRARTHYGRYEVVMRAARGNGVISSFFTYIGPYFDAPHDEVDIEFLGRDTTKLWANSFTNGRSRGGKWI